MISTVIIQWKKLPIQLVQLGAAQECYAAEVGIEVPMSVDRQVGQNLNHHIADQKPVFV